MSGGFSCVGTGTLDPSAGGTVVLDGVDHPIGATPPSDGCCGG